MNYTCRKKEEAVQKKLMITIYERVYISLRRIIGRFSRFKSYVIDKELETAYQRMAQDEEREKEALEWAEGLVRDAAD